MVTVVGHIQQQPPENYQGQFELGMEEVTQTAEDYLQAVSAVDAGVPEGWRVLYVEVQDESHEHTLPEAPEDPTST